LDYSYLEKIVGNELLEKSGKRFSVLQPASAEDSFKLAELALDNEYELIIFDSVGAISPEEELKKPIDKMHVGLAPRLMSQFLRKTAYKVRDVESAFVFTNQVRANIGSYAGGYTTPAGYALKHYTSLRIYMSKSKYIKDGDIEVGNFANFIIKKNKLAIPYRTATTNIIYGKGIDSTLDVLKFGALLGVIKVRGPYYVFEDTNLGQGQNSAIEFLEGDKGTLDKIIEMCYNVSDVKFPPIRVVKGEDDEQKSEDG
jgi:recombination protein RecA